MAVKLKPLDQQVIVITGASSGIGLATAFAAAEKGASVVLTARSEAALDDIARLSDTINYEAASSFSLRHPRIYMEQGQSIACDMPARTDHTE